MVQIIGERRTGRHHKAGSHVCSGTRLSSIRTTLWNTPTGRGAWASITTAGKMGPHSALKSKSLVSSFNHSQPCSQLGNTFLSPFGQLRRPFLLLFFKISLSHLVCTATHASHHSFPLGLLWYWCSGLCFPVWSLPCLFEGGFLSWPFHRWTITDSKAS